MNYYESGSIVWVKLSQNWWPGSVKSPDECPAEYIQDLKKDPLAIVKFFNETEFHHVTKQEQIFSYNCNRKKDFIKKGLNAVKNTDLCTKFEQDIVTAEKLTGGNMDLIKEIKEELNNRGKRIDYSHLGFGEPKVVKKIKDENHQRKGFTNIGEAILYKPGSSSYQEIKVIEHVIKIMEQPKMEYMEQSNFFRCYRPGCGFTCSRLNVIVWHNKNHLKTVVDFDSGIRIPYRKKRKSKAPKSKSKKLKTSSKEVKNTHLQTNGHTSQERDTHETKQLLLDWEDEDDGESKVEPVNGVKTENMNGIDEDVDDEEESSDDEENDGYDDNYPPPQPKRERQPMPKQVDINTAFDALLADSSPLNAISNSHNNSYLNNDSDSEGSWENYYDKSDKNSDSELEQESDIKDICTAEKTPATNGVDAHNDLKTTKHDEKKSSKSRKSAKEGGSKMKENGQEDPSPSSNSSNSSGPAYMLVAVDAHGNNVPMPVLSEGGNHLVAVEASMEDGTTRTLYIDPAHLGPNVDLNNLMLHIDNSGQETVIIPTSTSDSEIVPSTLVGQEKVSSSEASTSESDKKSTKSIEDSPVKSKSSSKDGESTLTKGESTLIKVKKVKKSRKSEEEKEDQIKSTDEDDAPSDISLEELPNLDPDQFKELIPFEPDEIVWALTHGNWWPSFVVKRYPEDKKVSIFYINCQQVTPLAVDISRIKPFNYCDFPDIFEKQKNNAAGLSDAMQMANQYKILKEEDTIKQSPKEFFSLPIVGQKDIIRKMYFVKRGIPIDDRPIDFMKIASFSSDCDEPSTSDVVDAELMEDALSGREKQKLESAQKARRTENEKYIRFIRSSVCLNHLRQICRGVVKSKRHDDFLFFSHQLHYWNDMNKRHNPGMDFFGPEDTKQLDQMYFFLESQFKEFDLGFLSDSAKKGMYVKLVLFPEAIKEALRHLTKLEEKKFENILINGIFQTTTEKKAKRLEFE